MIIHSNQVLVDCKNVGSILKISTETCPKKENSSVQYSSPVNTYTPVRSTLVYICTEYLKQLDSDNSLLTLTLNGIYIRG